ncbi:hypothetical protein ACFWVB_02700 [Streptomyces microflavus]|uniref:hypothetical protein n=1 Tax=Streptomyces microflavus TaxID=1919 RepID=UPI0036657D2D
MPPRRRKPVVVPARPEPRVLPSGGVLLDWSGSGHWEARDLPCRYCSQPTHLRDDRGRPADKVCAELALAEVAQVIQAQHAPQLL